jgi:hypothetical protein
MADVAKLARLLASMGRNGDTILAHITPKEAEMLHQTTDGGSINPTTGLPEFYDDSGIGGDTAGHGVAGDVGMGMADPGGGYGGGYGDGSPPLGGGTFDTFGQWADQAFGRDSLAAGIGGDPAGRGSGWSGMGRQSSPWGGIAGSALGGLFGGLTLGPIGLALGSGLGGYMGGRGVPGSVGTGIGSLVGSAFGPLGTIAGSMGGNYLGQQAPSAYRPAQPIKMIDKGYDISERFDPLGRDGTMMAKR